MPKVITLLLGHKAEVGKDTLGNLLVERNGFTRFGFADKLKDTVADLYNFSHTQMYEHDAKNAIDPRYGLTPRQVLIDFGQEQRSRNPNIWADYVFNQIEKSPGGLFVITDFRFPNEYDVAKTWASKDPNREIIPIKIQRKAASTNFAGSNNISETALDNFSEWKFVIENQEHNIEYMYNYTQYNVLGHPKPPAQNLAVNLDFMEQ